MKTHFYLILLSIVLAPLTTLGQTEQIDDELIELAKIYRKFHFSKDVPNDVFNQLESIKSTELLKSKNFISELIKSNNSITTKEYLTKPDTLTLKNLYIIRTINWNMHEADPKDNYSIIESVLKEDVNYHELLSCYYGMIFTSVGNKNRPFDMSNTNFTLRDYNLTNDTEKGVFFLQSMKTFGSLIWGYINVPNPPNYKKALEFIDRYPKYDGQAYYQYLDLNFEDFKLTTDKRKPKESFKKYYLNKYLETLFYHTLCLAQKNNKRYREKKLDVILGSIMKNESYWKYSENPERYSLIFKKVKN
jgi:hypothetical protein